MKQGRVGGQHMGTGKGKTANEERKAGEEARETEAERKGPGRRVGAEPERWALGL